MPKVMPNGKNTKTKSSAKPKVSPKRDSNTSKKVTPKAKPKKKKY